MKYNLSIFIKLVITIIIEDINNRIGEWAIPQWRIDFTSSLRMLYLNNGSLIHCCICYFNIRQYDSQQRTQWIKFEKLKVKSVLVLRLTAELLWLLRVRSSTSVHILLLDLRLGWAAFRSLLHLIWVPDSSASKWFKKLAIFGIKSLLPKGGVANQTHKCVKTFRNARRLSDNKTHSQSLLAKCWPNHCIANWELQNWCIFLWCPTI